MALPVAPPLQPMLAKLARTLPTDRPYVFEPKWDGFRCLVFRYGAEVDLRSRNQRPLARYFPEVVAALMALPESRFVMDGELVVRPGGRSDFAALMARLHPSQSRVTRLAAETPAELIAFDLLVCADTDLRDQPFAVRRTALAQLLAASSGPLHATPATTDPAEAQRWLEARPGSGIDGVVAKDPAGTYQPGKRALVKVKTERTADCVVAGVRLLTDRPVVSSLLLGLWDSDALRHVGLVQSFKEAERVELVDRLRPYVMPLHGHPWEQGFALEGGAMGRLKGAAGRWAPGMTQDWAPLRPELVAEVGYDQLDGLRFRHPAQLKRWRPDRDAATCSIDQLAQP